MDVCFVLLTRARVSLGVNDVNDARAHACDSRSRKRVVRAREAVRGQAKACVARAPLARVCVWV